MKIATAIQAFSILSAAYACGDGHAHVRRSVAPSSVSPPSKPLEWGDINILHTTDTHGWLLGHQKTSFPEPNYSGDFGDFASFVTRMKELAAKKPGADLLLIDSGDLRDGSGLTEGGPSGSIPGQQADKIFDDLPYDLLTIGNHELYSYKVALEVHQNFPKTFGDKYLTSNAYIQPSGQVEKVPIGAQVKYLKTLRQRSVTAFGVLFDFQGFDQDPNAGGKLFVTAPSAMVKEQWFLDAIKKPADLFIIPGHMPVDPLDKSNKWEAVRLAIRGAEVNGVKLHEKTPIIFLGGHSHIRNCNKPDDYSMSLQSGRFMETIGWLSVKLPGVGGKPTFSRKYLDANTVTYEYHTGLKSQDFRTALGTRVSDSLTVLADKFSLSTVFGIAPMDYTLNQKKFTENGNYLKLWIEEVLPYALTTDPHKAGNNSDVLIITNTPSQRFDVYSGPFTKNDQLSTSFYTDKLLFLPAIEVSIAQQVLKKLNPTPSNKRGLIEEDMDDRGSVEERYRAWLQDMHERSEIERRDEAGLNLGYVTKDACSSVTGDGDDTPHQTVPYIKLPDIINSIVPTQAKNVDLIFLDYLWDQRKSGNILTILNTLGGNYKSTDAKVYSNIPSNEAIRIYAEAKWKPSEN